MLEKVNQENKDLTTGFLCYLDSINRSQSTIQQYTANLNIFWCWNLKENGNKSFIKLKKLEYSRFQGTAINRWGWSPKRMRTVKATLSSLSKYIENMLDDDYPEYRAIINRIESPPDQAVREKVVFTDSQLSTLLDTLVENDELDKACAVALAAYSSRRKSELPEFKVDYFSSENLILDGALYKTPERIKTKGRGKQGKLLDVYILANDFDPYLKMWMTKRESMGVESQWLLTASFSSVTKNDKIKVTTLDSWAKRFSDILGVPFYWHSLRHFFTTRLAKNGIPDSVIQAMVGWDSADMVRLYDDSPPEEQFGKYFSKDGFKKVEGKSLSDLT